MKPPLSSFESQRPPLSSFVQDNNIPETPVNAPQLSLSQKISNLIGNFGAGAIKGGLSTLENIGKPIVGALNKAMPLVPQDKIGLPESLTKPEGTAQKVGNFAEKIAEFAIPGSKVSTATKGLSFLPKLLARSATAGTVATAQEGKVGSGTAIAAGTEALLPVLGKYAARPIMNVGGRLIKSLASGLSGAPSKAIDAIVAEPNVARQVAKNIDLSGSTETIKKNAETIINGVSKVRQDARAAYGKAVGELKETDINAKTFKDNIKPILDSIGSTVQKNGQRILKTAEFDNPTMVKKANTLINKLSTVELNGLSLNRLQNEIERSAFKTTGGDAQRLSFNAFIKDLSQGIRDSINASTDKLSAINKAYSTDLQLTEAVEGILGGVEYKNLNELRKVSEKLDSLFTKKGLSPQIVDDFLTKIGIKPSEFRATEAVRRISDVSDVSNTKGVSFAEILRGITSAVITPQAVRNLSIRVGQSEEVLKPILDALNPVARGAFIELLLNFKADGSDTSQNPTNE